MLTFSAILKATQQLTPYGDERNGAFGHLPKRIKGPYQDKRSRSDLAAGGKGTGTAKGSTIRRWDDAESKFVYVKSE